MLEFDFWTILFSVINILVLFFFLKKFLFGRVAAILEKRQEMVQQRLDEADQTKAQAQALQTEYEQTLSGAKDEAREIVQRAQTAAEERGKAITAEAQRNAQKILEDAQKESVRARAEMLDGVQNQIIDLAFAAAERVVDKGVDDEANRALVDAFLREEAAS